MASESLRIGKELTSAPFTDGYIASQFQMAKFKTFHERTRNVSYSNPFPPADAF